jgi:dienelactone hydrolase
MSDSGLGVASGDNNFIREAAPTSDSASKAGTFMIENYTDGYRQGMDYADSTIYYPVDATPPFAYVSVVPGFVSPQAAIQNWGPFLASHGIVAITIGTNTPTDPPEVRAAALIDALTTIQSENEREGSPLKGLIALDRKAVAGWSMGGGGTLIAAAGNPDLKAAVSFAAWGPSGGEMNKVPVLMFEATADPLAAGMSDGFYGATPDATPKMLFEVAGAGHDVANDPANSGGVIGRYGLSWFKVYLEGDDRYKQFLLQMPDITSNWETNVK